MVYAKGYPFFRNKQCHSKTVEDDQGVLNFYEFNGLQRPILGDKQKMQKRGYV